MYLANGLSKSNHFNVDIAADLYLEYGEEEALVALKTKILYGADYIELANYYKIQLSQTAFAKKINSCFLFRRHIGDL